MTTAPLLTPKQTAATLTTFLTNLGRSEAEIAMTLGLMGVRGELGGFSVCPIAVAVRDRAFAGRATDVWIGPRECGANGATVPTPRPIRDFIAGLAVGRHAQLLEG